MALEFINESHYIQFPALYVQEKTTRGKLSRSLIFNFGIFTIKFFIMKSFNLLRINFLKNKQHTPLLQGRYLRPQSLKLQVRCIGWTTSQFTTVDAFFSLDLLGINPEPGLVRTGPATLVKDLTIKQRDKMQPSGGSKCPWATSC